MNSIGPYFYALTSHDQAYRIMNFCEAIWAHNPDLTLRQFAQVVRSALRSMAPDGRFPGVVRVKPDRVIVESVLYEVSSAPEGTFVARATDAGAINAILGDTRV